MPHAEERGVHLEVRGYLAVMLHVAKNRPSKGAALAMAWANTLLSWSRGQDLTAVERG